jgi:hypothetical protein
MYEKIRSDGCRCLCSATHDERPGICRLQADVEIAATILDTPITIPMCHPCAENYRRTDLTYQRTHQRDTA